MECLCSCPPKQTSVQIANCDACTKLLCLSNCPHMGNATIGITGECFQRESIKDEVVISSFLIFTILLLVYTTWEYLKERRYEELRT